MSSPINVTTTPIILVKRNNSRDRLILQNEGKELVYIKRQPTNIITDVPSDTNYDFILYPGQGNEPALITEINSVAAYAGVVVSNSDNDKNNSNKNSDVAVMQTIKIYII